jgi:beta-N-acetylhexosaminidase
VSRRRDGAIATRRRQRVATIAVLVLVAGIGLPLLAWRVLDTTSTSRKPAAASIREARNAVPTTSTGCDAAIAIARWPLQQRLAQLLFVGIEPLDAQQVLSRYDVGGIYVNGDTTGQVTADSATVFNSASPIHPIVGIDEEGGRVQRIPQLVGSMPSARVMAKTMTPAQVQSLALHVGQGLKRYGITMDFAPVSDVSDQPDDDVIGDRSFSNDPNVVELYAAAFAAGLRQAAVVPILKHFPGHGRAVGDSQSEIAVAPPLASLELDDLLPYRQLLTGSPVGVMVGHLDVPGLTTAQDPASINAAAINGLLRNQMGFKGFVVTDDLESMVAVSSIRTLPEASLDALKAGATMVLSKYDDQVQSVLNTLTTAVETGNLAATVVDQDVEQVLALKDVDPCTVSPTP